MKFMMDRGPSEKECRIMCTAPFLVLRDRLMINVIYETWYRRQEVSLLNVKDYNHDTGELTARVTKGKGNKDYSEAGRPRHMILSKNTRAMMDKYIGRRKSGPLFLNMSKTRQSPDYIRQMIYKTAMRLGIQELHHITDKGRKYWLITPKSLREAGERHTDQHGADQDTTAKGAGHTAEVKQKYYKRGSWYEVQLQVKEHHPNFRKD